MKQKIISNTDVSKLELFILKLSRQMNKTTEED